MRIKLSVLLALLALGHEARASQIIYTFSGSISFVAASPYGIAPIGTSVKGQFFYDTGSSVTQTVVGGSGYEQHISSGFIATIGGIALRADDYLISIFDNVKQPDNSFKDVVTVSYSDQAGLASGASLSVNNVAHAAGVLRVSFLANSSLFSGTALPGVVSPGSFVTTSGVFSDRSTGLVDVLFTAATISVSEIPEPPSGPLMMVGVAILAAISMRSENVNTTLVRGRAKKPVIRFHSIFGRKLW